MAAGIVDHETGAIEHGTSIVLGDDDLLAHRVRPLEHAPALLDRHGQGLLDIDRLAGRQGAGGQGGVAVRRGGDGDQVHGDQEGVEIVEAFGAQRLGQALGMVQVVVVNGGDPHALERGVFAGVMSAEYPCSRHAGLDHVRTPVRIRADNVEARAL